MVSCAKEIWLGCFLKKRHTGQDIAPIRDRLYLSWCCGLAMRNDIKRRSLSNGTPGSSSLSIHPFYETYFQP